MGKQQRGVKKSGIYFGTQSLRISRCQDKVDVIVTDCPLLLTAFYNKSPILGKDFERVVANVFHSYNNINFLVDYNPIGRLQTQQETQALKEPMMKLLETHHVAYSVIHGDMAGYNAVIEKVMYAHQKELAGVQPKSSEIHSKKTDRRY